jgi:hypothetical protein
VVPLVIFLIALLLSCGLLLKSSHFGPDAAAALRGPSAIPAAMTSAALDKQIRPRIPKYLMPSSSRSVK